MKKRGGEKPRPAANAPLFLRKALNFSAPVAGINAEPQKDSTSSIASEESSPSLCDPLASKSTFLTSSSPPKLTFTPDAVSSATCPSSAGASSIVDPSNGASAEDSAESAGVDEKRPAAPFEFLAWACSTVRSEHADDLSKKLAAVVLNALEDEAAAERDRRSHSGRNLICLSRVSVAILFFSCV